MEKLAPLTGMLTLQQAREHRGTVDWGKHGVARPRHTGKCWAEVVIPVPFGNYDRHILDFDQCGNKSRSRYLTCSIHSDRELAARELRCELEDLQMSDIAYISEEDEAADRQKIKDELRRKREARLLSNTGSP